VYTVPLKLILSAGYEHQQANRNLPCLLCTLNTMATLSSSWSCTPYIASWLIGPSIVTELQMIKVSEVLMIQFLIRSSRVRH